MSGTLRHSGIVAVLLLWSALLAMTVSRADDGQNGTIDLELPRPAAVGESVRLEIRAGTLTQGARILISTPDGALIGAVAPFGDPRGQGGGTYAVPVPENVVVNGRVRLRISVQIAGRTPRPPDAGEIEGVSVRFVPVSP